MQKYLFWVGYTVGYKNLKTFDKTRLWECLATLLLNNLSIFDKTIKALEIRLKALILGAFLYVRKWSKNVEKLCKMMWVGYTVGYTVGYKIIGLKPDC